MTTYRKADPTTWQVSPWQAVRAQAKRIGKARTRSGERKRIVAWYELAKMALRSGK